MKIADYLLCITVAIAGSASMAHGQISIAPYAEGAIGMSATRTQIPSGDYAHTLPSVMAAANVGILLDSSFGIDAGVRSTFGIGRPFRIITMGARIRARQMTARIGVGRLEGFDHVGCITADCPMYRSEWTNGLDLEVGMAFRRGGFDFGPMVWLAQSIDGINNNYRSIGIGIEVRTP